MSQSNTYMSHVYMTCENHQNLRWSTKELAVSDSGRYTGARNIFYFGAYIEGAEPRMIDASGAYAAECTCSSSLLIVAPENEKAFRVQRLEERYNEYSRYGMQEDADKIFAQLVELGL